MNFSIKEQIICLLKENHSDWNDSIDINNYHIIIPMLESFYQHELIAEYRKLFEDESKLDLDQKLSAAGMKMASQKANKNQHQLDSDKIRALDKSLEKLQQSENALRSEIKSKEELIKGKSPEDQADEFSDIVNLRSELQDLLNSIKTKQKEKADLIKSLDAQDDNDNKPNYKRTEKGNQRSKLSDQEVANLESDIERLTQQHEKVTEHQTKLHEFLSGHPITKELMGILTSIDSAKRNLRTYVQKYSDAQSVVSSTHTPNGPFAPKATEVELANKLVISMPDLISSTREEIASLEQKYKSLLLKVDTKTQNAVDSLSKSNALKMNISDRLESAKLKLDLDKKGEEVISEPVKVVGKDPLAKESTMVQFRKKLSELSQNFVSMYNDAVKSVESGNSSYPTPGAELSNRVRAFYGDQKEANNSQAGVGFKNNARIGTGRDLINQLSSFITNELSKSTDRESQVLHKIAQKYKFSTDAMSSNSAFLKDVGTLNSMLKEIKHAAQPGTENIKIGKEFIQYIDQTLDSLNKFASLSPKIAAELNGGFVPPENDIDDVSAQYDMTSFNAESLISALKLINTLGAVPEIAAYPQLVAHIKRKVETISQLKSTSKATDEINNLINQITSAIPATANDEKIKSIKSLLSSVETNRQIKKFINSLESTDAGYILPNSTRITKDILHRLINRYRNGKGLYQDFYQDVLNAARRVPSDTTPASQDKPEPTISTKKTIPDYDKSNQSWNKLSIKK